MAKSIAMRAAIFRASTVVARRAHIACSRPLLLRICDREISLSSVCVLGREAMRVFRPPLQADCLRRRARDVYSKVNLL